MVATIEGAGVELAYEERGAGPPVVLVHGMASRARDWGAVAARLADRARVIAYDRRGYGASGAPEPYERTTVNEQAEDLAALLDALGARGAIAAGADLGALVIVDVLRRHPAALRAAVLVDPPAFMLVADATEALAEERLGLEEALRDGGPPRAVELYLGWQQAAPARVAAARERPRSFFADYASLATLPLTRRELRGVTAPVVILDGPYARPHQRAASDALARMLARGRREAGGGVVAALDELLGE
jgi:pimeloyl-ACP methyl ester carboxylesterase